MPHTTSALTTLLSAQALLNEGVPWSTIEAAVELCALGGGVAPVGVYTPVVTNLANSQSTQIPVGVLSWSVTCLSGNTGFGLKLIPTGITLKGGGYHGRALGGAPITVSCGPTATAIVIWELPS